MEAELVGVAERLAAEFPQVPALEVMATVCSCSDECDHASPFFVEQATRARLGRV
jgi:hypothetical protein